jgi:hypothetical protein
LRQAGVGDPSTIHYGNEKSVEGFSSEPTGVIAGCISPSDEDIKDWIVLLDKNTAPKREIYDDYRGGQKWVGPDAQVARELIKDVREDGVLQACGRYARSPRDPDNGATVYVLTNVIPDDYADEVIDDVEIFGKKQKQMLSYLADSDNGASVPEIIDGISVSVSKKHLYETVKMLRSYSLVETESNGGKADVHKADRSAEGYVEL